MATQQELRGHWNELVGRIKRKWGDLTDDDITATEGNVDRLVGLVQRKTGESREAIEEYLDHIAEQFDADGVLEKAKHKVEEAREHVQETAEHIGESIQEGYHQAEKVMRRHPLETVAVSFGVGVLSGLVVGLMLRSR